MEVPGHGLQPGEEGEKSLLPPGDGRLIRANTGQQGGLLVLTLNKEVFLMTQVFYTPPPPRK
jgi:hypothetical protein